MSAWILENPLLACHFVLEHGELTWHMTGRPGCGLDVASSQLGAVIADGRPLRWRAHGEADVTQQANDTRTLTLNVLSEDGRLRLRQHAQIFPAHPFVRLWAALENIGDAPVTITGCAMLDLRVSLAGRNTLFHVEQFSWNYRPDKFALHKAQIVPGRAPHEIRMGAFGAHYWAPTSCAWAALRTGLDPSDDPDAALSGDGLVIGIEFNGKSRLLAWSQGDHICLRSTIDDLAHLLAPEATFDIPACFLGRFHGDWDEAGYATQRFAEAHVHPPLPDDRYPWAQYNSWGYGQDINEAQQMEAIARCAELGIEAVVMDLGWARCIGDWRPDPAKFPRGLRPLSARCAELGMRFGVHIPLAQMNLAAPAAQAHPDWLIHTGDDYFGAAPICLGHAPCREWLIGEILKLIDEEGVNYIVQDGEDMVKRCWRTDHTHAPGDSNYANSERGLDLVIAAIRRERPHVVLENCEDGGCMLTYKMARLYHTSITVDNIATYGTRQGIYGASYPFSPRYSARYMQDAPNTYTLLSAIFGGPLILMQRITEWTPQQLAEARAAIAKYKELRPLVRDAKVIHLIAPRHSVNGAGWGWDAIQAVSPDRARSAVMVFRAMGDSPQRVVRPRGLQSEARYRVRSEDRGALGELTGAALMQDGLALRLAEFDSDLIWIEAARP